MEGGLPASCLENSRLLSVSFLPDGENGKEEPAKQDQGVEQRGRGGLVPCLQFKLRKSRSEGGRGGGAVPSVVVPPQCSRLFFQFQVLEGASTPTVVSRMGSEPNKVHPDLRIMAAAQKEWLGPGIVGIIAAKKEKSQIQIRSIDDGTPI